MFPVTGSGVAFPDRCACAVAPQPAVGSIRKTAALDQVIPHPVYARQRWIAILNPSRESSDEVVKPLIGEAYARLARQRRRPQPE